MQRVFIRDTSYGEQSQAVQRWRREGDKKNAALNEGGIAEGLANQM
jgi:hypothetical protein